MGWQQWSSGLIMVAAIAACAPSPSNTDTPSDPETTTVSTSSPTEPPTRIVALTSLTADLVATLDPEALVGISGSSILREDPRFAAMTVVSEGRVEPDLEKILALEPDLVIGAIGFHDRTLARLEELEIPVLGTEVNSWEALEVLTLDLAQRLGQSPEPLLTRYDACLSQPTATAPTALVLVSRQPLLSPNKDSWAGDFLARLNIPNLTADLQGNNPLGGYVTLSEEEVLAQNPEQLLVVETEPTLLEDLQQDPFWGQLAATQGGQVETFDYFGLVNPGSLASIEQTCQQLAALAN